MYPDTSKSKNNPDLTTTYQKPQQSRRKKMQAAQAVAFGSKAAPSPATAPVVSKPATPVLQAPKAESPAAPVPQTGGVFMAPPPPDQSNMSSGQAADTLAKRRGARPEFQV